MGTNCNAVDNKGTLIDAIIIIGSGWEWVSMELFISVFTIRIQMRLLFFDIWYYNQC